MERSGKQIASGEDIGGDACFIRAAWPGFGFVGRCLFRGVCSILWPINEWCILSSKHIINMFLQNEHIDLT